ncbi:WD repeat protein Lub1 [Schizosaccharomyces cryophilus OY26]|uniref:WD repeat protein Lub1 n=1 Tax=Schizosaccharomyces cryophilus (strain OY26 / ATCC MYA-4695 / CBS 11777 / NBRC 106824 / NRRL Y48691) TaxID=653667 RepID=S9XBG0_SCHCR|nr:WD repeat protein Lub1 [Schizosaccharomyces cryophilus OY26]EPY51121.1 WD repeat protein Lub1 [Schizosaccharomyces cryophilus OY26]
MTSYVLSKELVGHEQDVRAVCSISDELIGSASRDGKYGLWKKIGNDWTPQFYEFHEGFVNSVCYVPPSDPTTKGFLFSGGQDCSGILQEVDSESPAYYLFGHESNICSVHALNSATIITGSWDSTARVWSYGQCRLVLRGHESSVWAVLALGEDSFVTGSADKTIKIWKGDKLVKSFEAHVDCVRSLCKIPQGFASCSNDGTVKLWSLDGHLLQELHGHTSFVYSLTYVPTLNLLASCGEDKSVRIWKESDCIQRIALPTTSIWSVCALPDGDIACGSSDGYVRVFTMEKIRMASEEELKNFERRVSEYAIAAQEVGDVKKGSLPGPEILTTPGKNEGDVVMVRVNNDVEAYQWSQVEKDWKKVGQVVDAVGSNRKQLYKGQEYDYVFDVDVAEGQAPLKLPYNVTENPFQAAIRFLETNQLPMSYTDEVVQFIQKNIQGHTFDTSSTPQASNPSTSKEVTIFPVTYLLFTTANIPAMCQRLLSLNTTHANALPQEDLEKLQRILSTNPITDTDRQVAIEICLNVLDRFSFSERFPALDALRLLAIQCPKHLCAVLLEVFAQLAQSITVTGKFESINSMLTLRGLANLAPNLSSEEDIVKIADCLFKATPQAEYPKDYKVAFATLAMNLSILHIKKNSEEAAIELLPLLTNFLATDSSESESCYRALMALGSLCTLPNAAVAAAQVYDARKVVDNVSKAFAKESRFLEAKDQFFALLDKTT